MHWARNWVFLQAKVLEMLSRIVLVVVAVSTAMIVCEKVEAEKVR